MAHKFVTSQIPVNVYSNNFNTNNNQGTGLGSMEISDDGSNEITYDTLINLVFAPSQGECNQILPTDICINKELPCFYEFLETCTAHRDEDLVYGLYCLRHTNATNRTFTAMGTQNTVNMQPISLKTATCERNMFLWSFLTNVTYAKAKDLISFMNISTNESSNLAKFIMAVSEPRGTRQNSEEFQSLQLYLSAYCQAAIKCLDAIPDRDKIIIPINMSTSFLYENRHNNLIADIKNKGARKEISTQTINANSTQYFVPLSMLNILDQINLLSFRMYCGVGRIALAPNVSISNNSIFVGSGLSIRNALSNVDIGKLKSHYPDSIYRLIRNIHGDNVHNNYDILVLLAVPSNVNISINPQLFIAKRKFIKLHFDLDKLEKYNC